MYRPDFRISPHLLGLVTQATELNVWIRQAVIDVSWLPILQRDTAARLAHSSTAIEGNPLTLPEVKALARGEEVVSSETAKREVLNYLAAMRWIWKKKSDLPVTEADLLWLHRLLTKDLLARDQCGRYKNRQNRVVDARGRLVYTPPPPNQAGLLTRDLLVWLKSPASKALHPILASAIAHHRLVSIHPFKDGNGRVARALAIRLLSSRGYDTHHLGALDEFFEQDRPRYYRAIQQARELDDDLTHWLEYVAEGAATTLRRTQERILSLQVKPPGAKILLTRRQEDVLRFLRDQGRVKTPDLEREFKFSRARAGQILKPLVDGGLIIREGHTRSTTYRLAQ